MNSTGHALTSWWLARNRVHAGLVSLASIAPDAPYFAAFAIGLSGIPRAMAGGESAGSAFGSAAAYAWSDPWMNFLAQKILHNVLFATSLCAVALALRRPRVQAIALGLTLHVWVDLSLHVNDAYAIAWPLTSRVFPSPVSYWDPEHHGRLMAAFLALITAGASLALGVRLLRAAPRRTLLGSGAVLFALISTLEIALGFAWKPPDCGPARSWVDDGFCESAGFRFPEALDPIAAALPADPAAAEIRLAELHFEPHPGRLPWERQHLEAIRVLLGGFAKDLAGHREDALGAYHHAEQLEPVGTVGDKARRYSGEVFSNAPDPAVSPVWAAMFFWGIALAGIQLRFLPARERPGAR